MSVLRLFAVIFIFCAVSVAWMILGGTMEYRTAELKDDLSAEVNALWGPADLVQTSPYVVAGAEERADPSRYADPLASEVNVSFRHDNRYKGLLWFSTYTVAFEGRYTVRLPATGGTTGGMLLFRLPSEVERVAITLDGQGVSPAYAARFPNTLAVRLANDADHVVTVAYEARGRDSWRYRPGWCDWPLPTGLRNFSLTATTNFADIDYAKGSVSPASPAAPIKGGVQAAWKFDTPRTDKWIGIVMPARPNAGPIAARMSFFAPVSLLFFFTVLFTVCVLKRIALHPMHYLFVSAGFFAFHILLAYLVDKISIHAAFWICAATAVLLVVSYMRLVAGVKFAVAYVGAAELVYLLGFSYAFFYPGWTGLAIVIGAIITLFVLMQATGRVNWFEVFARPGAATSAARGRTPPPPPTNPPAGAAPL
ncbi:MAG TPA: inner membrane CreD family protein [Phycisphaerae bacterium]|nr:inner membrane CreD family protein [Phycisphaerae bacterium]